MASGVSPYLSMSLIIVPDERTAYQALLKGDLHLISTPPDIWEEAQSSREAES